MRKSILAMTLASTAALGACAQNPPVAQSAVVGAAGGAAIGAVATGTIEGAAVGAAIGGLAGAVWADTNNDGYVDGYMYNGPYYSGTPTGHHPHTHSVLARPAVGALVAAAAPVCASAESAAPTLAVQTPRVVGQSAADFYRGRNDYPLWLAANAGDAADQLLGLLSSASLDGLDPAKYHVAELQQAVTAARTGKKKHVVEAGRALSEAIARYLADLKRGPGGRLP